jgi:hypothetical protein
MTDKQSFRLVNDRVRAKYGEAKKHLWSVVFPFEGDECLIWPFARNSAGYGHLIYEGRHQLVSRLVCAHGHGPAPSGGMYAAHSCGNGHLGCCNKRHLRWATPTENSGDTVTHGTRVNGERLHSAKLTDETVRAIRASNEPQKVLAKRYGVTQSNISFIRSGKTWGHVA